MADFKLKGKVFTVDESEKPQSVATLRTWA